MDGDPMDLYTVIQYWEDLEELVRLGKVPGSNQTVADAVAAEKRSVSSGKNTGGASAAATVAAHENAGASAVAGHPHAPGWLLDGCDEYLDRCRELFVGDTADHAEPHM